MPSTTSLITKLQADFPQFTFTSADQFRWSPAEHTIYYNALLGEHAALLHELSHGLLDHATYVKDIQLIEMERDAWNYATTKLAPLYSTPITDDTVQEALDTYRDWLHARSTCPGCKAIGIQTKKDTYKCIACTTSWRVNEARMCALRRYPITN